MNPNTITVTTAMSELQSSKIISVYPDVIVRHKLVIHTKQLDDLDHLDQYKQEFIDQDQLQDQALHTNSINVRNYLRRLTKINLQRSSLINVKDVRCFHYANIKQPKTIKSDYDQLTRDPEQHIQQALDLVLSRLSEPLQQRVFKELTRYHKIPRNSKHKMLHRLLDPDCFLIDALLPNGPVTTLLMLELALEYIIQQHITPTTNNKVLLVIDLPRLRLTEYYHNTMYKNEQTVHPQRQLQIEQMIQEYLNNTKKYLNDQGITVDLSEVRQLFT